MTPMRIKGVFAAAVGTGVGADQCDWAPFSIQLGVPHSNDRSGDLVDHPAGKPIFCADREKTTAFDMPTLPGSWFRLRSLVQIS